MWPVKISGLRASWASPTPLGRAFVISASTLMSGTVAAQAINFSLSFLLARLYEPYDFGHYSIVIGVAAVLAAASTFALDRVIILARTAVQARKVASAVLLINLCFSMLILFVGVILTISGIDRYLPLNALDLIVFIPLFMLLYGGSQVFIYSSLRNQRVSNIAVLKVAQSSAMGVAQIALSFLRLAGGLVVGNIVGWMLPFAAGLRWRIREGFIRRDMTSRSLLSVVQRHWRYPRYIMPNEAIDNLSNQAPIFLIGMFVSLSSAGYYGLAILMLSAPAAVLGQAVGQAFFQFIGRSEGDFALLRRAVFHIWIALAILGFLPFLLIGTWGGELFAFAFGGNWADAGRVAAMLSPLLFVRFVSSPTSTIYLKLEMQREQWWFCVAGAVYRVTAYGFMAVGASLDAAIMVHVVLEIIAICAYNLLALRRLSINHSSREHAG